MILTEIIKRLVFPPYCPFCKSVLPMKIIKIDGRNKLFFDVVCEKCKSKLPPEPLMSLLPCNCQCVSPVEYVDEYKIAVLSLKENGKKILAQQFGRLVSDSIKRASMGKGFDVVISVPMSEERMKKQGFNHAQLISKQVSEELGIPCCDAMYKTRDNNAQHSLNLHQRKKNVKNVYSVRQNIDVVDKRILLIDDVVTTGYTLSDCTRALFEVGAKTVHCATVAKTPSKRSH